MATTTNIDGIIYVERNYQCHDCEWSWTHITVKGDQTPVGCPNCEQHEKQRLSVVSDNILVKDKVRRGKSKPKSKIPALKPGEFPAIQTMNASHRKKAVDIAYQEMEQRGFTNMADNAREGDIHAPKLDNAVTRAMETMNRTPGGMATGFTGDYKGGTIPTIGDETGGTKALGSLQQSLKTGQRTDKLASAHRIYEPKAK